ncbi:hypothetical protein ABIC03_007929 [Bradyrhizobium sp. RT6a]
MKSDIARSVARRMAFEIASFGYPSRARIVRVRDLWLSARGARQAGGSRQSNLLVIAAVPALHHILFVQTATSGEPRSGREIAARALCPNSILSWSIVTLSRITAYTTCPARPTRRRGHQAGALTARGAICRRRARETNLQHPNSMTSDRESSEGSFFTKCSRPASVISYRRENRFTLRIGRWEPAAE